MSQQIVLDHTGDTRHEFNAGDVEAVAQAVRRFAELTGKGYRAVALGTAGAPGTLLRAFDARVEETLCIPQLRGG
jgi:hypothetical protein